MYIPSSMAKFPHSTEPSTVFILRVFSKLVYYSQKFLSVLHLYVVYIVLIFPNLGDHSQVKCTSAQPCVIFYVNSKFSKFFNIILFYECAIISWKKPIVRSMRNGIVYRWTQVPFVDKASFPSLICLSIHSCLFKLSVGFFFTPSG